MRVVGAFAYCELCKGPPDEPIKLSRLTIDALLGNEGADNSCVAPQLPHVTVSHGEVDGELCFEWWFGADEKITVYATPTTVLRKYGAEQAEDPTPKIVVDWLREATVVHRDIKPSNVSTPDGSVDLPDRDRALSWLRGYSVDEVAGYDDEHERWVADPGRFTVEERDGAAGAAHALASEIRRLASARKEGK